MPKFQTTGICRFSPVLGRGGSTRRRDGGTTEWWLVLDCDRDIGRYLRALYREAVHRTCELSEPLWGTHISVVRGEKPPDLRRWKSLDGVGLDVEYGVEVAFFGDYAVVPARCEAALDYREVLGLSREPDYPLHMTIGNRKMAR